jgi:lipopolysaccharide export LptBFGC system permease protein LptF
MEISNAKLVKFGFIGLGVILFLVFVGNFISFSNSEIDLRNTFEQKMDERTSFYDKMFKIISQKTQIAVKNDESFRENVNIIMAGRKDSEQVFFKWITESNPNANYETVSAIYQDLSRAVEAQREGFFIQEKVLQDIVRQHKNLIQKFPNSFYNFFFGRLPLEYKPISSDITNQVMNTSLENDFKLDL